MKIMIEGKEFSKSEMDNWKRKQISKVLRNLKKNIPVTDNVDVMCKRLTQLKFKMSYKEIESPLKTKLWIGEVGMKLAVAFSGSKRKAAITTIFANGITAEAFSKMIDSLMMEDTPEHRKVNLAACPAHYVLAPHNDTLEVIETTGNAPVPTRFFITFNDETGLQEPRNLKYPYQSTGIAKLKDGTVIGGVRHQFRDTQSGLEVRTLVEFPGICPQTLIREHQKHLAVEWSYWIAWAIRNQ